MPNRLSRETSLIFGSTPKTPLIGMQGEEKRFAEPEKRTSPSTYRWATPRFTGAHIERIFSFGRKS
jgi:hypothetical protein